MGANLESIEEEEEDDIVIVGGGFGGLNAALSLSSMMDEERRQDGTEDVKKRKIILMDEKERFVFLPLLYELCIGDASVDEVAPTFASLLSSTPNIEFVQARISGVDNVDNCIYYTSPSSSSTEEKKKKYSAMIVATGSELQLDAIPGATQYALPFYTVEQCFELKRRFQRLEQLQLQRPLQVVIVGGGYSGVELALNTIQRFENTNTKVKVTLIHRGKHILQNATPYNSQQGIDKLQEYGVQTLTQTSVLQILPPTTTNDDSVSHHDNPYACQLEIMGVSSKSSSASDVTQPKEMMAADLLLWTAGATSSNRVSKEKGGILNSKLPRDAKGRIVTGNTLRVKDSQNVFAIGDCARTRKKPYAATAQVAMQQAPVASYNLFSTLTSSSTTNAEKKKLISFSYLDLGEMMTLGSNDATITSLQGLVQLNGPAASILRRLIYSVRMPTTQQSISALFKSSEQRIISSTTDKIISKKKKQSSSSSITKDDDKKKIGKIMQW
eukprot:CAMPEP_0197828208 /NCGR_PEP_ID=MMETSP1437-20131217/4842_1 /TAXON_ID=49252 ORGANISM="Eucampia antarctica, Strain CCMP1452" /NCGR_SAMPLE_ID=MMETSP1437 /ASSEMBLY_ACC=CAM_ASM_001096 /LENGTH=497 /DNA_ID=CAMNT_0043429369 /DNA_START=104 /DNA_END=1594 /DNA_ORIENTATION=-